MARAFRCTEPVNRRWAARKDISRWPVRRFWRRSATAPRATWSSSTSSFFSRCISERTAASARCFSSSMFFRCSRTPASWNLNRGIQFFPGRLAGLGPNGFFHLLNPVSQLDQLLARLIQCRRRLGVLLQVLQYLRPGLHRGIKLAVDAGDVGADVHQVFDLLIGRKQRENSLGGAELLGRDDVVSHAADGLERIDGRIMAAIGEGAAEPEVAVGDSLDGVGDGLVEIVAFDEDGVKTGDRAAFTAAGALEKVG